MRSIIAKRSIVIDGHKTSVSLEDAFWNTLKHIARERNETLSRLVASIDRERASETCLRRSACSCSAGTGLTRQRPRGGMEAVPERTT